MTTADGARIGLFSLGLEAYWSQRAIHVENLGLIDTPEKAFAAGHQFRHADIDLIFLHVATYGVSSTVLPVVRRAKTPVIILNLAPGAAIDYAAFNRMPDRGA